MNNYGFTRSFTGNTGDDLFKVFKKKTQTANQNLISNNNIIQMKNKDHNSKYSKTIALAFKIMKSENSHSDLKK